MRRVRRLNRAGEILKCRTEDDLSFLRNYLTPELVQRLNCRPTAATALIRLGQIRSVKRW